MEGQPKRSITLAYRVEIRPINTEDIFKKTDIKEAFVKAKKENKKILLFFTAPWCGPCNWMKKYIHTDNDVRTIINKRYITVKINSDTQKGKKLSQQYSNNKGIPFYVILTPENKLIKNQSGSRKKDDFLEFITPDKTIVAKEIEMTKPKLKEIDHSLGLRLGAVKNNFYNTDFNSRTGFTADLFYSKEINDLYLFRTGIGYNSKGFDNFAIKYLRITPIEFVDKIFNGSLINTQGGIRAIISPYYAFKLNKGNKELKNNDYGVRFGLSHFIGSDNELELELYYEHGMQDIFKNINGKQNNRGLGVSLSLSL